MVFSVSFLLAPFFIDKKLRAETAFTVYAIATTLLIAAIFLGWFPACYVEGRGLTDFKIASEYVICLIFLVALGLLARKRRAFDPALLRYMVLSLLSSVVSELSFTQYVGVYGFANLAGHYFELLSYILIYRAIVVTGMVEPTSLLFRNLKQSEDALQESEARYRSLFENMIDGFAFHKIVVDQQGKPVDYIFLEVNSAFEKLTGLKRQDIIGKRVTEALPGIDRDPADWIGRYGRVALEGTDVRFEQYAGPLNKWFSVSAYSPMREYFVAVFEDITERKRAEEALRVGSERYRSFIEVTGQLGWTTNAGGEVVEDMPSWREYTGQTFDEIKGWEWSKALHPDDLARTAQVWRKAVTTNSPYEAEYRIRRHDGIYRYFMARGIPVFKEDGSVREWVGTCIDITERKEAENAMKKAHDLLEIRVQERTAQAIEQSRILESFFKHTQTCLVFLDKKFNFIRVNEAYARACARDVSDFSGRNHFVDYPSDELKGNFQRVVDTKEPYIVFGRPFVFPDHPEWGVTYWDLAVAPILDNTGEVELLVFSLLNVTERKKAEERISRLNRLYSVLSKVNEAIVRIHAPEKLYERLCRIAVEDGFFKMAWIGIIEPEMRRVTPVASYGDSGGYLPDLVIYATDAPEGKGPTGRAITSGSPAICSDIENDPVMRPWRERALRHGFRSSAAFPLRSGATIIGAFTIYAGTPQFFTDEEQGLLSSLAEDISFAIDSMANEKKRLEAEDALRRLNEELELRVADRTKQLEAANKELEAFAYSVSHDLRAPLRFIDGFSLAIEEEEAAKLSDAGKDYVRRVRAAARKMAQLIEALLTLSRVTRGELSRVSVDLSSTARTVADELRRSEFDRQVEFAATDGVKAEGDPVMLRAVIDNLIGNAWKFTSKTAHARIEFGVMSSEFGERGKKTPGYQLSTPNSQLVYYVRDNGAGFDMTYANKLFMAFQRLHSAAEFPGLGIGLATVQRIIHRHGGRIWAEGEVGKGATFYFTLG